MFVLPSVVSEHSSRLIGDSTVLRVDAHSAMAQGKESRLLSSTRHVVSWSLVWCVLIFSLFGHVSRIWGLVGVAVDSV